MSAQRKPSRQQPQAREAEAAPLAGLLGVAAAASLIVLAALGDPTVASSREALRRVALFYTFTLPAASAAAYLAPRLLARRAARLAACLDEAYRRARRSLSHGGRVKTVDLIASTTLAATGLSKLADMWPLTAAGLGVAGLYSLAASYAEAWRAAKSGSEALAELGVEPPCRTPPGPPPLRVALAVAATGGLAAPLVARWLRRIEECLDTLADTASTPPGPAGAEAAPRGSGEEGGGEPGARGDGGESRGENGEPSLLGLDRSQASS